MSKLKPEHIESFEWLGKKFDRMFNMYFSQLRLDIPTKLAIADTQKNRIIIAEFQRYLKQRAEAEGWEYNAENFQINYVQDITKLPNKRTMLYNPQNENTGFEEIDLDSNLLRKLNHQDANTIRDNLKDIFL